MLTDKVALITGGGTGIGRATGLRLAREGAHIAVNYSRSAEEAATTCRDIEALGRQAMACQASVTDDEAVRAMVESVVERFGRLDILVNSAGITRYVALDDLEGMSDDFWDDIMAVNVKGLFRCCRAAAPLLKAQRGCIVNITSVAGLTGQGSSIAYAASKAAAISVTRSLARVLAPEVRVNSVAPGIVLTRWVEGQRDHVKRYSDETPLGRVCRAEDVAEVAYSLVDAAGMITGQSVVVDGGMFM